MHWRQWLQQGDVLLLLDGLDELEGKPEFLSLLRTTLETFTECPTIVTCRTVSFEQHRSLCVDFPLFTLADLAPNKRDAFIRAFGGMATSEPGGRSPPGQVLSTISSNVPIFFLSNVLPAPRFVIR